MCLIICKLMLLGRLATKAAESSQADSEGDGNERREAEVAERAGAAEFVPGDGWWCCCGQCCGHGVQFCATVAGVYFVQSAGLYDQAAAACDAAGNDTKLATPPWPCTKQPRSTKLKRAHS